MIEVAALCIGGPLAGEVKGIPADRLYAGVKALEHKAAVEPFGAGAPRQEVHYSYEEVTLLGRAFPVLVLAGLHDRERAVAEALLQPSALALWRAAGPA